MYQSITLKLLRKHPSGLLLAAQTLTIVVAPLIEHTKAGRVGLVVFGNVILALALWVILRSPLLNWIGLVLAIPAVGISLAAVIGGYPEILWLAHLFEAAVYFYAAIGLIVYMLADTEVTMDELLGIGATFTLLAWAFTYAFSACQHLVPGSFSPGPNPLAPRSWFELLFFSFSVLSSVGLSDIMPVAPVARSLAMLEMFCGVMYVAMVVSCLIGMFGVRRQQKR